MKNSTTFVTALFDIGRDKLSTGFSRSFEHYKESFSKLLKLDINLVIYCEPELEKFIWKYRDKNNTKIISKNKEDYLKNFPFFDQVQKIRKNSDWYNQAGWIKDSTQASLEYYNPLVMSKQFMLHDVSILNFFNSKYFFWIDAGIANTVNISDYFSDKKFENKLIEDVKRNKMLYVCFPYDGTVEVHGFAKQDINRYAGEDTKHVARGGFFGGTHYIISKINEIYYNILNNSLNERLMGTEESIFTIITYQYPDYCNLKFIELNGLIYKYFDEVKKRVFKNSEEKLALYFLTYNLPKQLEKMLENFEKVFPNEFKECKKYLINNSTNKRVERQYNELIKRYDLKEFKFDNIGICGGRHFAAEHFERSEHEYMMFFEDDMLFFEKNEEKICSMGFTTYHEELFDKCLDIIEENELDYLKLSFSEVFGNNHDNWAWQNMNKEDRKKYLKRNNAPDGKSRIFYTGSHRKLPYAIGEYHYCNWPIIMNKKANYEIFLRNPLSNKYEQVWMANTQKMIHNKKIKVGCLLASPIKHKRFYHYGKKNRKENEKD